MFRGHDSQAEWTCLELERINLWPSTAALSNISRKSDGEPCGLVFMMLLICCESFFQEQWWIWTDLFTLLQLSSILLLGIYEVIFLSIGKVSVATSECGILKQSRPLSGSSALLTPDYNISLCMLSSSMEKISEVFIISHCSAICQL